MSQMLSQKRSTRGLRMTELVGEALENDNAFYTHDTWNEEESDSSFSEEEVKPDVFDSDFNDTEDDDDSDDDSEEEKTRKAERSAGRSATGGAGKYKEPARPKPVARPKHPNAPKPQKKHIDTSMILQTDRGVRASTVAKTESADAVRKMKSAQKSRRAPPRIVVKHKFTQKELLLDALNTEEQNDKWLRKQKELSKDVGSGNVKKKLGLGGNVIRFVSRRGTYDTITFTEVESMPSFLLHQDPPKIPDKMCKITGQIAKYKDPVTGFPYATIEAFNEIKRKYHNAS